MIWNVEVFFREDYYGWMLNDQDWTLIHTLTGHEDAVSFVSWSHDDSKILTCSNDNTLSLWSVKVSEEGAASPFETDTAGRELDPYFFSACRCGHVMCMASG